MDGGASETITNNTRSSLPSELQQLSPPTKKQLWKIASVSSIGIGLQFGWAVQFSLLIPYVKLLGIPAEWASYIVLCGPISGFIAQPLSGYYSDMCASRFGRRRPFIAVSASLIVIAVLLIGYAADLGHLMGDDLVEHKVKPRAITIFVIGFWAFDVGNNMLMSPCRALLADLSNGDQRVTRSANAGFTLGQSIGAVLGFAAGAKSSLHEIFPFTLTKVCDRFCANLKSCFFISIILVLALTVFALCTANEEPVSKVRMEKGSKNTTFFKEMYVAVRELPRSMWILFLVVCFNAYGFFSFFTYDTDWMGSEIYGGNPISNSDAYGEGVHEGSTGLVLSSTVAGVMSLVVIFAVRGVKAGNRTWGFANIVLAICLAMTVWISKVAERDRHRKGVDHMKPELGVRAAALTLFSAVGIPQAVGFTVPYAIASSYSNSFGTGQGLSQGILNIAYVIPLMIVSLTSGHINKLFGGGNLPNFIIAAVATALSGVFAFTLLPSPPSKDASSSNV